MDYTIRTFTFPDGNSVTPQDFEEFNGVSNFPVTGKSGQLYVDSSTNEIYRWNGSSYVDMGPDISGKLDSSLKGAVNGLAELDSSGKVPSSQLPSYVDDVVEAYYYDGAFYEEDTHTTQITPESGKIYVDITTNKTYRWSGSAYTGIASDLALGETSSTAYRGDRGAAAYAAAVTNVESSPSSGSSNLITSGAVYSGLDDKAPKASPVFTGSISLGRKENTTVGTGSTAIGDKVTASGNYSHAEGGETVASGLLSHAEGGGTTASGAQAHAEGAGSTASGAQAHAEGGSTTASGTQSHAEGGGTTASENYSHAEGGGTTASGYTAHAEGAETTASGYAAHVEGNKTTAIGACEHVSGAFNVPDTASVWTASTSYAVGDKVKRTETYTDGGGISRSRDVIYRCKTANSDSTFTSSKWEESGQWLEAIGNGTANNSRSNARALDWSGNERLKGDIYVGCNADSSGGTKLTAPVAMTGADGTNTGTSGYVPAPAATDNTKYLKGDGTWADVDALPTVSSTDNGKILKVINGVWAKGDVDSNSFATVSFTIETTDWSSVTGGYKASITDNHINSNTFGFVIFDASITESGVSGITSGKNSGNTAWEFISSSAPIGSISGTLYLFTAVPLVADGKVDIAQGSQNAGKVLKVNSSGNVEPAALDALPSVSASDNGKILKVANGEWGVESEQDISGKLDSSLKGTANGLAELDSTGKVPSSQLPSYVDDVIEGYYYNGSFYEEDTHTTVITGETGKIYVDLGGTNKTYRWSGSAFVEISESLALGETSSTAYRGDRGATAYSHATDSSRLTTAQTSGLYKIATTAEGHIASVSAVEKSDITGLGIPAQDTTYSVMTGADGTNAGASGLVPAPAATDNTKFLRGDGTWENGGRPMVILSYGNSTWSDFITAYNNNVIVYCRASSNTNPATGSQTRMAFMAYVNNATSPTEVEFQYYRSVSTHSDSQQGDQVYVYKLTSSGTWTVTVRSAFTKIVAGTNLTSSYSNGALTISGNYSVASTSSDGLMSSTDKTTLGTLNDSIATYNFGVHTISDLETAFVSYASNMTNSQFKNVIFTVSTATGIWSTSSYYGTIRRDSNGRYNLFAQPMNGVAQIVTGNYMNGSWSWEQLALNSQITALNNQIATKYASVKYNNVEYVNFMRFGKAVFMSCVNGNWDSDSGTITLNGQSTPVVAPTGFRPAYNVEIKEALNNKRITVNTSGSVSSNESFTGTALRYSGCWITNDAMPT